MSEGKILNLSTETIASFKVKNNLTKKNTKPQFILALLHIKDPKISLSKKQRGYRRLKVIKGINIYYVFYPRIFLKVF